ncbi:ubiquinone biosynthesis accessory factor UbiJ [Propionivibrio limicola]|uniref:ubiquinone biosynthesis accessory factor UbiJ n=1 Tax=Propionivibrio limicola TaxID=167645 RepID=UPI00129212F2|nr:SCP2 sterol-binding domain-containing protein [Propionivibrio limicola]
MLLKLALAGLNHLLANEEWARNRLKPFAGQTACLKLGALAFPFSISAEGRLQATDVTAASVTIQLPADAPVRMLLDRNSLFSAAHISGPAEFAENLGFVFRHLRWDIEADLADFTGDIVARRLVKSGRQLANWQARSTENLARNVAEYVAQENRQVATKQQLTEFSEGVQAIASHLEQLERRIAAVELRAASRRTNTPT